MVEVNVTVSKPPVPSAEASETDHVQMEESTVEGGPPTRAEERLEEKIEELEDESPIPVDRGWAWAVVIGCFGMHVLVVGGVKSFGVLFVELQNMFGVSAKQLGVVHGLASVVMMALGPVSNALSMRFSCRAVVFAGGMLMGAGFITTAFVPSFPWLYFTYSAVTGLGLALAYAPSVVMVGHHFTKRRALANGISVSGSGVGSFLLPNLMRHLLNVYGLRDALLLIGAIMFHVCACAALFRPLSSYKAERRAKATRTSGLAKVAVELSENSENIRGGNRLAGGMARRLDSWSLIPPAPENCPTTPQLGGLDAADDLRSCPSTDVEERPCSSFKASNADNDSMVNLQSPSSALEARTQTPRHMDRSSTSSSVKTLGSFKTISSQSQSSERNGSLKHKSPAGRATGAAKSSSFKRRKFQTAMRASVSLERHPSALWDARQPGSLKMPSGVSRSKTVSENSASGQAIEMACLKGGNSNPPDSPDKKTGKGFGARGGSFKAVNIVNPIRFIQERKKLLLASNIRYMSETGESTLPADTAPEKKAHLKRFYSVEAGPRSGTAAAQESFIVRRIRQLSEAESWSSESSLFASAGDLALASLQNISESATEADNEDVFSVTSSSKAARSTCAPKHGSFFRLSAQTMHKGETKNTSVPLFDWALLFNPVFLVFFASLVCMNFSYPNIFLMLPSYCQEVGMDKNAGAFMVSIIGLADLAGRIFIGWFSDLHIFPRKYSFLVSLAAAGLLCTTLPSMKTWQGLVAFCSCFGFCGGCFIALIAVILVDLLGKERLATSFGLASVAMAVGLFAGPAIYGSIRDTTDSWDLALVVAGLMSIAAACSMLMEPPAQRCMEKPHTGAADLKDELL